MSDSNIGWDNGWAPNKWQAIMWSHDGPVHQRIYTPTGLNELAGPMVIYQNFVSEL